MRPRILVLAAAPVVCSIAAGAARGADTFTFEVVPQGERFRVGSPGQTVALPAYVLLGHAGVGSGAGGWSLGVAVEGATVLSATTAGTWADTIPNGGYRDPAGSIERIHIIDPAENEGVGGVVSSVVLTTQGLEDAVLPPLNTANVLTLDMEATIPGGGGVARLECRGGLIADGEAFPLTVGQEGVSLTPSTLPGAEVILLETSDCCDDALNVGFSEAVIKDGPIFEGIAGVGEKCLASGGEIISDAPLGAVNSTTVHVNIISNLPERNVQGWSFGVAVDGAAVVDSITTAGTAADMIPSGGYRDPESSLGRSSIIDPSKNGGQKGVVASLALTTAGLEDAQLPAVGTQTILRIDLSSAEPQGEADQTATLRFQEGLVGTGLGVSIVVTVWGESAPVCNIDRAGVTVVFRKAAGATFRRGDANDDDGVNIADAIWILNALFSGGDQPGCTDSGDVNDSGTMDISDPVYLVNYLFVGTDFPPPPAPGPAACGLDPTGDALECLASSCSA
jgi:hypothetical protein